MTQRPRFTLSRRAVTTLNGLALGALLTAGIGAQNLVGPSSTDGAGRHPDLAAPEKVSPGSALRYDVAGESTQGVLFLLGPASLAKPAGVPVPGVGITSVFDLVRDQAALFQHAFFLDGNGDANFQLHVPPTAPLQSALVAQAIGFDDNLLPTGAFSASSGVRTSIGATSPVGAFTSDDDLTRARARGASATDPLRSSYSLVISRANGFLTATADPFTMSNMTAPVTSGGIKMAWYGSNDGADNSLRDAVDDFMQGGHEIRTLALAYALSGDVRYGDKAVALMRAWAAQHTPVNMYDFNIDFANSRFDGMVSGWVSGRPWNFALDSMWQTYGLTLISDAYMLLTRNGFALSSNDDATYRAWILECTEAVNAGHHAWTRWADAHPNSSVLTRYRSDNHLSWALTGLMAAGAALGDSALVDYVLSGGSWTDRRAGSYANPSHIRALIDRAIESDGRVYEEAIMRDPPVGYAFFHLSAMGLVARMAEVHTTQDIWSFRGADGAGLERAFDRYAGFLLGTRTSPDPAADSNLAPSHSWTFEMPFAKWGKPEARQVLLNADRRFWFKQAVGPAALLVGESL